MTTAVDMLIQIGVSSQGPRRATVSQCFLSNENWFSLVASSL